MPLSWGSWDWQGSGPLCVKQLTLPTMWHFFMAMWQGKGLHMDFVLLGRFVYCRFYPVVKHKCIFGIWVQEVDAQAGLAAE